MEVKNARTLKELQAAAKKQNLTIEEKYGRYRVFKQHSIKDLSVEWREVEAGAGYSLNLEDLRDFLSFL